MMGEIMETMPAMRLITPKAMAIPASDRYLGISFCRLTLSNPKVSPQEKRMKLARNGFPVTVKRIMAGDVAKMWNAKEISPLNLSTSLPLGKCPMKMPSRCNPSIKLIIGREKCSTF